jgi:transcriptional/translational regulatory protein YebC/TACO1
VLESDDEEAVLEALMMADVDVSDIEGEEGKVTVFAPHTEYFKAKQALMDGLDKAEFEVDDIQFVPQATTSLNEEAQAALHELIDTLEYLEDVQSIYHNAE